MNGNGEKMRKIVFDYGSLIVAVAAITVAINAYFQTPVLESSGRIIELRAQVEQNKVIVDQLLTQQKNDLHSVQVKLEEIAQNQITIREGLVRLETLIGKTIKK